MQVCITELADSGSVPLLRVNCHREGQQDFSFLCELPTSPFSPHLRRQLTEDYAQLWRQAEHSDGAAELIEKYLRGGRYLGDALLGEDHQLLQVLAWMEQAGYAEVEWRLESAREEFFAEYWEALIAHESRYVLSTQVKRFVRVFRGAGWEEYDTDLDYGLHVPVEEGAGLASLFGETPQAKSHQTGEDARPLRVLHLVARPHWSRSAESNGALLDSNAVQACFAYLHQSAVIDYRIQVLHDAEACLTALQDSDSPLHILHCDAPLRLTETEAYLVADDGAELALSALGTSLGPRGCRTLFLSAGVYSKNGRDIATHAGLAQVARLAHAAGFTNVVGLAQALDPFSATVCFDALYRQIANAHELGTAVVEARKALQKSASGQGIFWHNRPLHLWPLLEHYSLQKVRFFARTQTLSSTRDLLSVSGLNKILYGFRADFLPPHSETAGDGQSLDVLSQLLYGAASRRPRALALQGGAGLGKTQLLHNVCTLLALSKEIDYAFYFDFSQGQYSERDIWQMIAPVLGLSTDDWAKVAAYLAAHRCCFVFDSVQVMKEDSDSAGLIHRVVDEGHIVLMAAESAAPLQEFSAHIVALQGMNALAARMLASGCIRQRAADCEPDTEALEALLDLAQGHPWLIKKMLPLVIVDKRFDTDAVASIREAIAGLVPGVGDLDKIAAFYRWQWQTLSAVERRVLLLVRDSHGVLLELIAAAQTQADAAATATLFAADVGTADAGVSLQGSIVRLERAGFLRRLPFGHVVEPRCLGYLQALATQHGDALPDAAQMFVFSQWLCEGLRLLVSHLLKQANPALSHYLLLHRRHWALHFETLWFNGDYRGFTRVKWGFDQLLQQASLAAESRAWTQALLQRTEVPAVDAPRDAQLAWLALVNSALDQNLVASNAWISQAAEQWQHWLNAQRVPVDAADLALYFQVAGFLEGYYALGSQWRACLTVCQHAEPVYRHYAAWEKVLHCLKSIARYAHNTGERELALAAEARMVDSIPYGDAPPGTEAQQMLDILMARAARQDTVAARDMLQLLRAREDATRFDEVLQSVACDLDYQDGNYMAALPYYAKLWSRALQAPNSAQIAPLHSRLLELREKVGEQRFDLCFDNVTAAGTVKPVEYEPG